jgi:deoxycytidylate deaminase
MRPSWDWYFLDIADVVKTRSVCTRRQVGALVVGPDHRIISTGYNGSPPGNPDCPDLPCPRASSGVPSGSSYAEGPGQCIAVHAETNAILYAGRKKCLGTTIYSTHEPCPDCQKLISAVGIARVVTPSSLAVEEWAAKELDLMP